MDLELKELGYFIGTNRYYQDYIFKTRYTDGIKYIQDNGYSWFVTDVMFCLKMLEKLKTEDYVFITLKVKDNKAVVEYKIDDSVVYRQKYKYTDAKVEELKIFYKDGILALMQEY